jgi:hypothetical protein
LIIRPTDKEIGEDICIAAAGYGLESIARDETATIAEPASVDSLLRGSRDSRQIENNTGWLGICFQDLGLSAPLPPPTSTTMANCPKL